MMFDSPIAKMNRALAGNGFVYLGRNKNSWLTYAGSLIAEDAAHPILLAVHPQGSELPIIVLEKIPDNLLPVAPHLSGGGGLCYAAASSIVLDVFDVAGQTLACIERAAQVLGCLLRGEMATDLEEEFFAYWRGDVCFLDIRQSSNNNLECIVAKHGDQGRLAVFVTNERFHALEKIKALGAQPDNDIVATVCHIRTKVSPRPMLGHWPPRTVRDILHWQGVLDPSCRRKLDEYLTKVFKSGKPWMLCIIESPKLSYAFWVDFTEFHGTEGMRRVMKARELAYRAKIFPVHCIRVDDEYIAQRNTPGRTTLTKRKIALVGCGTIGGFLAELLVKAGAGSDGGELALIDNDSLWPQNIGRHRLGFNAVLKNKAVALAEEVRRSMPGANIQAMPVDVIHANLARFDIVINATGEEALGHLLTTKLQGPSFVPILTVWVEGPGIAARALLRDHPSAACSRCLSSLEREPLYTVLDSEMPMQLAGQGCESLYVPFSASVSVQAACLAIDMLTNWVNGEAAPRLRTRIIDERFHKSAMDQNPASLTNCPACGT